MEAETWKPRLQWQNSIYFPANVRLKQPNEKFQIFPWFAHVGPPFSLDFPTFPFIFPCFSHKFRAIGDCQDGNASGSSPRRGRQVRSGKVHVDQAGAVEIWDFGWDFDGCSGILSILLGHIGTYLGFWWTFLCNLDGIFRWANTYGICGIFWWNMGYFSTIDEYRTRLKDQQWLVRTISQLASSMNCSAGELNGGVSSF